MSGADEDRCPECGRPRSSLWCLHGTALGEARRLARASRIPDAETFRRLVAEGQELRRRFDRDTAGMRVLTAEDRARVSR